VSLLKVIVLAFVQGLAELLPVSSSAHVIVAEKLMGLDPSSPQMTLLLVMLHTGTMFAVIAYFWTTWKDSYFASKSLFRQFAVRVIWATALTGLIGEGAKKLLEKTLLHGAPKAEIEQLFSHLELIAPALAAVGVLILIAGLVEHRKRTAIPETDASRLIFQSNVTLRQAGWMGIVQGLALPFRGFSRSGSTISTGMLVGTEKAAAERFSFALAVVLTPAVVGLEAIRLWNAAHLPNTADPIDLHASLLSSLLGMVFSFFAGLLALKWLSRWLETGRWYLFGIYCIIASAAVYALHAHGF
jgi:undecaprenyl-diphosphatase